LLRQTSIFTASARSGTLDLARGVAVLAMVVFHLCFDLMLFGYLRPEVVFQGFLPAFSKAIAASFLALSGLSFVLSLRGGLHLKAWGKRLGMLILAASAISLATSIAMPHNWVRFGILHSIAACSVLGLLLRHWPAPALAFSALITLWIGVTVASPAFNAPALLWLGLGDIEPLMMDYEPLFPWAAPFLAGMALAKAGSGKLWWQRLLGCPLPSAFAPLQWAGRHSLALYLVHQPILFGLLWAVSRFLPPSAMAL